MLFDILMNRSTYTYDLMHKLSNIPTRATTTGTALVAKQLEHWRALVQYQGSRVQYSSRAHFLFCSLHLCNIFNKRKHLCNWINIHLQVNLPIRPKPLQLSGQSTGLVNQGSRVQFSSRAYFLFCSLYLWNIINKCKITAKETRWKTYNNFPVKAGIKCYRFH